MSTRLPPKGVKASDLVISTVKVEPSATGDLDMVEVWNHGTLAGTLYVRHGDGEVVARALMPDCVRSSEDVRKVLVERGIVTK